jgi:hypothetical protein
LFARRLTRGQKLRQHRPDTRFTFPGRQVKDADVLAVRSGRAVRHQGIVGAAIHLRRIQVVAVHVAGERSRLANQPFDDMAVIDPMLVRAPQTRHPLHQLARVPHLDLFHPDPRLDLRADQPRRHRIGVVLHPDRAATLDAHAYPAHRLQTLTRQATQQRHLLAQFLRPATVALRQHATHQRPVLVAAGKVPAATQP